MTTPLEIWRTLHKWGVGVEDTTDIGSWVEAPAPTKNTKHKHTERPTPCVVVCETKKYASSSLLLGSLLRSTSYTKPGSMLTARLFVECHTQGFNTTGDARDTRNNTATPRTWRKREVKKKTRFECLRGIQSVSQFSQSLN